MPALRGLSSGRTLILIDGARVNSERRVGASATFLDPDILEGVEVARGPGSVAYGSRRLRRRDRRHHAQGGAGRARWRCASRARSAPACPSSASAATCRRAPARAASSSPPTPATSTTGTARRAPRLNSGYQDGGVLARVTQMVGAGLLLGRLPGRLRPRHRAAAQQLEHRALLLSRARTRIASPPSTIAPDVGPFDEIGLQRLLRPLRAGHRPGPLRHRHHRPQRRARRHQRPTTSSSAATRGGRSARPVGVGRRRQRPRRPAGARHHRAVQPRRQPAAARPRTSRSTRRGGSTAPLYTSLEAAVLPWLSPGRRRARLDYVASRNSGGYFGDRSVDQRRRRRASRR